MRKNKLYRHILQRIKNITKRGRLFYRKLKAAIHLLFLVVAKYALAYFYIIVVTCGGLFIFLNTFLNKTEDTTSLTNVGFGIFAVIANVCFSWAKLFQTVKEELAIEIGFQGERLLFAALLFLVASFLKYTYLQKTRIPIEISGKTIDFLFNFIYYIFFGAFLYAYIMATAGIYELFGLLFRRHLKPPNVNIIIDAESSVK